MFVSGWDGDPPFDRQDEFEKMLEAKVVKVVAHFGVGVCHAVEINEPTMAELLFGVIKHFIYQICEH